MLAIREPEPVAPDRFVGAPPFEPASVHAIPRTIAIATKNPFQAKKEVVAGLNGLKIPGETRGRSITRDRHNFSVRPLGRGPIRRTVKRDLVACIRQGAPEAFQVGFGAAGPGKPPTNKTNFH